MKYTISLRESGHVPILAIFYMQRSMTAQRFHNQFMHELAIQHCLVKGQMLNDPLRELMLAMEKTAAAFYGRVEFETIESEFTVEV